jgi:hypothetical protein
MARQIDKILNEDPNEHSHRRDMNIQDELYDKLKQKKDRATRLSDLSLPKLDPTKDDNIDE